MSGRIRAQFAFAVDDGTNGASLDDVLAGLGAALGANDRTNIERHIQSATTLGVSREQLEHAIAVAQSTQESAMRLHHRAAAHALDGIFGQQESSADQQSQDAGCGCQAEAAAEPVPA